MAVEERNAASVRLPNLDKYFFQAEPITEDNREDILRKVLPIYNAEFRPDLFVAVDRVRERVAVDNVVQFAIDRQTQERVGFSSYRRKEVRVDGRDLVVDSMASRVIAGDHQGKGIATHFSRLMLLDTQADAITGLTINPFAFLAHVNTGMVEYDVEDEEKEYEGIIQRGFIAVLGEKVVQLTDPRYGRCEDVFPHDKDLKVPHIDPDKHPLAGKIWQAWTGDIVGIKPENFDGKRYWLWTDKDKLTVPATVNRKPKVNPLPQLQVA